MNSKTKQKTPFNDSLLDENKLDKILVSDIYAEFSQRIKQRRALALTTVLLAIGVILFQPIQLTGDLTFSKDIDPSASEIVVNELFATTELDQLVDQGNFQWRWIEAAGKSGITANAQLQFAALFDFFKKTWQLQQAAQTKSSPILAKLYPLQILHARNNTSKTLQGKVTALKEGFQLEIEGQHFDGTWNTPIKDKQKAMWEINLAKYSSLQIGQSWQFQLLTRSEAKQHLLSELSVKPLQNSGDQRLKLEHRLNGLHNTYSLLPLIEKKIQSEAFQSKLIRRLHLAKKMENSLPQSHLLFEKHRSNTEVGKARKHHHSPDELLALPEESTTIRQKQSIPRVQLETFEDRASRYFNSKIFEPHLMSSSEPIPAIRHWLLWPMLFAIFFLFFVFGESLFRIFWKGVPLSLSALRKRGFMALANISTIHSPKTLQKIGAWLIEEKKSRFQLREVPMRVLVQGSSFNNTLEIQRELQLNGAHCQVTVLENQQTSQPIISKNSKNKTLSLKLNFSQESTPLSKNMLAQVLTKEYFDEKTEFILLQCPLPLHHPLTIQLQRQAHFIISSDLTLAIKQLKTFDRAKTLFICSI